MYHSLQCLDGWNDEFFSDAFHVIWRWTGSSVHVHDSNIALILVQWPLMRSELGVHGHWVLEDQFAIHWGLTCADAIEAIPQEVVGVVGVLSFAFFQTTVL